MRNKWRISHLEYLHVDLRRLAFRTLFEAVTDAFTKESEQQVDSTMALTICENKVTFSERSYAHCSMCIYMHPRTFDPCLGDESRSLPVGRTLYFQFRYTDPSSHLRQYPFGHQSMASVAMTNRVLCMNKFLWCEECGVPKERVRFEVYDLGYDICPLPRTETVDRFPAWLRGVASPPRGQGAV